MDLKTTTGSGILRLRVGQVLMIGDRLVRIVAIDFDMIQVRNLHWWEVLLHMPTVIIDQVWRRIKK
jgi:hypothetical protein